MCCWRWKRKLFPLFCRKTDGGIALSNWEVSQDSCKSFHLNPQLNPSWPITRNYNNNPRTNPTSLNLLLVWLSLCINRSKFWKITKLSVSILKCAYILVKVNDWPANSILTASQHSIPDPPHSPSIHFTGNFTQFPAIYSSRPQMKIRGESYSATFPPLDRIGPGGNYCSNPAYSAPVTVTIPKRKFHKVHTNSIFQFQFIGPKKSNKQQCEHVRLLIGCPQISRRHTPEDSSLGSVAWLLGASNTLALQPEDTNGLIY